MLANFDDSDLSTNERDSQISTESNCKLPVNGDDRRMESMIDSTENQFCETSNIKIGENSKFADYSMKNIDSHIDESASISADGMDGTPFSLNIF